MSAQCNGVVVRFVFGDIEQCHRPRPGQVEQRFDCLTRRQGRHFFGVAGTESLEIAGGMRPLP